MSGLAALGTQDKKTWLGRLVQWCLIVQEVTRIDNACPSLEFSNEKKYSTKPRGLRNYFRYIPLHFEIDPHTEGFSTESIHGLDGRDILGITQLNLGIN